LRQAQKRTSCPLIISVIIVCPTLNCQSNCRKSKKCFLASRFYYYSVQCRYAFPQNAFLMDAERSFRINKSIKLKVQKNQKHIFCHWLTTGRWFSSGTPVSSTNKTDCHDQAEILLKVVLNTVTVCFVDIVGIVGHHCLNFLFKEIIWTLILVHQKWK
jgi:hypothetical protein